jgi:hypothetical protein
MAASTAVVGTKREPAPTVTGVRRDQGRAEALPWPGGLNVD